MARHIFCLVRENCEGCNTAHLSQTHHACLSMGKFKRLEYFDAALQRTSEAAVMKTFTESLTAMDLSQRRLDKQAAKHHGYQCLIARVTSLILWLSWSEHL